MLRCMDDNNAQRRTQSHTGGEGKADMVATNWAAEALLSDMAFCHSDHSEALS